MKLVTVSCENEKTSVVIERDNFAEKHHKSLTYSSRKRLERVLENQGDFLWHVIGRTFYTVRFSYGDHK